MNNTAVKNDRKPLFSYRAGTSAVHRLPAILKLLLLCVLSIRTFSNSGVCISAGFTAALNTIMPHTDEISAAVTARTLFWAVCAMLLFAAARTPVRSLISLSFVPVLALFTALCRMITTPASAPEAVQILNFLAIDYTVLPGCLLYAARFLVTSLAALVIFETTSAVHIRYALEDIESAAARICPPLKKLHLALMLSTAISFIPEIFRVYRLVYLAAAARSGRQTPAVFVARISALLSCLFARAEQTARAVQNRCTERL